MSLAVIGTVAAVAGVGLAAYGMATAPGAPSYQAPPPPPNYTQYDEDGNIMSRQVFNSKTNSWDTYSGDLEPERPRVDAIDPDTGELLVVNDPRKTPIYGLDGKQVAVGAPYTRNEDGKYVNAINGYVMDYDNNPNDRKLIDETMAMWNKSVTSYDRLQELIKKGDGDFGKLADYEKELAAWQQRKEKRAADKATLAELRTQMLDNLNKTPEDRVAAYDAYAKSFSDSMHADVDPRFQKLERGTDEQANATGMFGSRAYVDTKSELAKDKLATDTDIANQATMAKESLANNDRQFWAGMLDQIDSGARADKITTAQINQSAASTAAQNYAGTLGYYSAKNANRLAEWEAKQARSASYVNAGSNLAGGLLYLYGGKTGGGGTATGGVSAKPTGGGVQRYGQNFSLLN